jgi:hypothetical protein
MPDSRVLSPGYEVHARKRRLTLQSGILLVGICTCQYYNPVTPPRLGPPEVTTIACSEARLFGTWREAIHLEWRAPATDSISIRSYTLLRQTGSDSTFDVFSRSQGIPDSITRFDDDIKPVGFPDEGFFIMRYRILAVDTLGRSSDTSATCSLYLARQPEIDTIDPSNYSFRWFSQFIQGSVNSYITIWDAGDTTRFSSAPQEEFGSWDYRVYFSATLPDSMKSMGSGVWYYSIRLFAMGTQHQSIKVDSFNVRK